MYRNNKLASSVRYALLFGASSTAFVGSAIAQEDGADVERIQVTGSRIQRTDIESANPISVFTAEDLAASGHVTVEGFVHSIPAMNGGYNGRATNNGSGGAASASMRGLGASRTLILINGRRYASGDLNSIPMSFIERVEVLRDGASTIYGSDAIAGVINFITRRDFEGAEITAQYDVTGEGDGETTKVAATIGTSSNRGNVVLSLEYTDRQEIGQGDRAFSRDPLSEIGGELVAGGSGTANPGVFSPAPGTSLPAGSYVLDESAPGGYRAFDTTRDSYNFAPASYLVTPQKVFSINSAATYELTQDVTAFLEGGFTNRQSNQLMAADGTFWGATMAAAHPGNPIGEDIIIARRLEETGGRRFTQDFSDFRMVAGLEGYLDNGWAWDASYNYARYVDASLDLGRANPARYNQMLDPAECDEACPGLWNPLIQDSLTDEQLAYASVPNSPVYRSVTKQLMANLTGDTGNFGLPAGTIGWAVGFERRWQDYEAVPDGGAVTDQIYSVTAAPSEGAYVVDEVYGEVNVPLLAGHNFAERLDLSAAVRWSDYDFLSSQTTTKFGLEYVPVQGLLVRSTWSEGFRAPSITNLFGPQTESNIAYVDPCTNWGTSGVSQQIQDNCAAEGLAPDFTTPNNQSASIVGGNPDLTPEESESFTLGFVWSSTAIENFSLAVDYYNIEITNGLGSPNASTLAAECYNSADFSAAACDLIEGPGHPIIDRPAYPDSDFRAFDGIMSGFLMTTANIATFETSGIDFDANWSTEALGGQMRLRLDGTYLSEYKYQAQAGATTVDNAGYYGSDPNFGGRTVAFPELRANFTVGYSADMWDASWIMRFQSGVDDINAVESNLVNSTDAYVYHDVQGSYFFNEQLSFTAGIRNLLDKQPPYVSNSNDMNTLNTSYDTAGRYLYGRVTYRF